MVSVIIPAYNAARTLGNAMECVVAQTFKDWEVVIVDDGSTDNTLGTAKAWSRFDHRVRVLTQENMGAAAARNAALKISSGRYIAFLDSDDIWMSRKLEVQLDFMRRARSVFSFTGYYTWQDGIKDRSYSAPAIVDYKTMLKTRPIRCSTVILDRQFVDPTMPNTFHEDLACWLKIMRSGHVAHGLDEELCRYRIAKGAKSYNKVRSAIKVWKVYREHEHLGIADSAWYVAHYALNSLASLRHQSTSNSN